MGQPFIRNRITWVAYVLLALYSYFLNILGPITPFLHDEFGLSFTVSSLHFSAFAVGMLVVGLAGHRVIERAGREQALAIGALGLGAGALLLVLGRDAAVTIGAAFVMGCVGSLILAVVPAVLSEAHGELRGLAISEANVFSTIISTSAPLLVGWLASLLVGWRLALVVAALLSILIGAILFRQGRERPGTKRPAHPQPELRRLGRSRGEQLQQPKSGQLRQPKGGLPRLFWFYWVCIVLAVSVEFCMIGWSADYMERELGLPRAAAAQTVSLFLGAMIVGRFASSRALRVFQARSVVLASLLLGLLGFLLFWSAGANSVVESAPVGMVGLALTGLGVAGLYPLLLSLAIGAANGDEAQAGARATLASGSAILLLPLALGRLADLAGLKPAFTVVAALFGVLLLMMIVAKRVAGEEQQEPAVECAPEV